MNKISLGTVSFTEETAEFLNQICQTHRVGQGEFIKRFENELKNFFGVKHAIAVSNGTAADAIALAACNYKNPQGKNEVILPAMTFIAQANAILEAGFKPVFVDVDDNYQVNVEQMESKITDKTLALMPVHLFGKPANMADIMKLAKKHDLPVIEDTCDAVGSKFEGKYVGTIGTAGCLSFYIAHTIAAGEGGAILTDDDAIADLARSLRNHGKKGNDLFGMFTFDVVGFSAKMNEMEAAVGLGATKVINETIARRKYVLKYLNKELNNQFVEENGQEIVPHCYPILLKDKASRSAAMEILDSAGIEVRPHYPCLPTQTKAYAFLGHTLGEFPNSENLGDRGLYVPSHQNISEEELVYLKDKLSEVLEKYGH